jgi:Cu-Zn family superoxide dismutase
MIQSLKVQRWTWCLLLAALVVLPLAGCAEEEPEDEMTTGMEPTTGTPMTTEEPMAQMEEMSAMATLENATGESVGTVTFTSENGSVRVVADFQNAGAAGMHGFHVHEAGECTPPDFTTAGGHFNPEGVDHACPPTTPRHAGDMGNVELGEDGSATFEYSASDISLGTGPNSIVGKAVILHEGEDDCATQPTGDAGARLACGLIALSDPMATDTMEVDAGMDDEMGGEMEEGEEGGDDY